MANESAQLVREEPPSDNPLSIVQTAINKGASVEVLERLLALQERYERDQARKAYAQAMADMRPDLPEIIKNREVDFRSDKGRTHYKYEDLSSVTEALSPVMAKHGLSFRWRTESLSPDTVKVTCIVTHRDGHCEEVALTAKHDTSGNKNPIQAIGSAVTYLQRYTLKAAVGVAAAFDDDGQSATPEEMPPFRQAAREPMLMEGPPPIRRSSPQAAPISENQRKRLYAICNKKGIPNETVKNYLGSFGYESSTQIRRDKYEGICQWAENWDALNEFVTDAREDDIPDFEVPK